MSVTESEIVSTEEKTLNNEDNIYSDLMTEIELGEENVQLMPEVKNINNCDQNIESADLSTENESSNILSRDVAVSEFFDTKNDEFIDNQDLIVSEVESEGIDFKNDTDVVNCTEEYEDKKLLFEDDDECTGLVEETDAAIQLADEDDAEIQLADNIAGEDEQYEIPNEDESRPNQRPVRYHTFPTSKKLCARWGFLCRGRPVLQVPKYARVCSDHFSPDCYKRDLQHELLGLPVRHRLRPDAVPNLKLPGQTEVKQEVKSTEIKQNGIKQEPKLTDTKQSGKSKEIPGDVKENGSVQVKTEKKAIPDLKWIQGTPEMVKLPKAVSKPNDSQKNSKQHVENKSPNTLLPKQNPKQRKRRSDTDIFKASLKAMKKNFRNSLDTNTEKKKMSLRERDDKVVYTFKRRRKTTAKPEVEVPVCIKKELIDPKPEVEVATFHLVVPKVEPSSPKLGNLTQTPVNVNPKPKLKEVPPLLRKINENDIRITKVPESSVDPNKQSKTDESQPSEPQNSAKRSADDIDLKEIVEILQKNRMELEYDQKLPVRSSIRIAKKNSIKHTSGPGIEPKSPRSKEINEKLKFMAKFNLRFGFNPGRELKKSEQDLIIQTDKIDTKETIKILKNKCENMKRVQFDLSGKSVKKERIDSENVERIRSCIVSPKNTPSLNRMHVMEDVEEGCNVSGALPSSPGHAEQRSATAKESAQETSSTDPQSPITNGIAKDDHQSDTDPQSPKSESEKQENGEIKTNERVKRKNSNAQREDIKDQSNEDSNSNDSLTNNKRKVEEEDSPAKKLRTQIQQQYVTHDRILTDYLESTGCSTIEDFQAQSEQLLAEIRTLNELAREKEREWNNILHLKKVKEELLLRLQRKRQILLLNAEKIEELDLANDNHLDFDNKKDSKLNNNGLMMVPIVSSSPANTKNNQTKNQLNNNNQNKHRPILPKPNLNLDASNEFKTGRQGPILDVRSIIADYRQRHPETVPRRGRRLRSVLNNSFGETMVTTSGKQGSIMNLTSQVLGSGAQVRHGDVSSELGLLLSTMDAVNKQDSRPSSADSSSIMNNETMSFKDVLVQFARLSQSERQELQAAAAASLGGSTNKPPYPEVTLHAVQNQTNSTTQNSNASLLHGILTKNQTKTDTSKPTTFSPTLARLLTAPERVSNTNAQAVYNAAAAALNSGVSISDLLTTPKSRNEITITPIGSQFGSNSKKDADNIADEEAEDSADRLVIDEGGQDASDNRQRGTDTGSDAGDDVPQCQGCHQKSAQFVCAGCGNQWYCSRDCQVAAWDEHSEVCSG